MIDSPLVCYEAVFTACIYHDAVVSSHCVHKVVFTGIAMYVKVMHIAFMRIFTSIADMHFGNKTEIDKKPQKYQIASWAHNINEFTIQAIFSEKCCNVIATCC